MQSPPRNAPAAPLQITVVAHDIGSARGGMERQLTDLLMGLRADGHEVLVIGRRCELPPGAGVHFHHVRAPGRPFALAYPWFMLAGTLAVHRHRRGIVQSTGAIVLNRIDVLAVHYVHQEGPVNPSRDSGLFRANAAVARILKRLGERLCVRIGRPRAVLCVSGGVAEEMTRHFPDLASRIVTVHNGVDTTGFAPGSGREQALAERRCLGASGGGLLAAFVGGEWERKGLESAIRAIAETGDWGLLVAGSGERERYQQLARSLGVEHRVHWLGVRGDVNVVYGMADAFVLPSSYETFSLVTFEAAASGLPVLATPVSGVRELIDDGVNGYVISREPSMIAERLRRLSQDPALRARLGAGARESALAFSSERMVAEHERLYERLSGS